MINPCFPLRRAFLLFFMLSLHQFFEHFLESTAVILSVMCLSRNTIDFGITVVLESFDIFISSLLLDFRGALAFMFCYQIRASEIPLYRIMLWTLQSCIFLCFMLLIIIRLMSSHKFALLLSSVSCILLIVNPLSIWSYIENIYII